MHLVKEQGTLAKTMMSEKTTTMMTTLTIPRNPKISCGCNLSILTLWRSVTPQGHRSKLIRAIYHRDMEEPLSEHAPVAFGFFNHWGRLGSYITSHHVKNPSERRGSGAE